jgi:hypothetical protein
VTVTALHWNVGNAEIYTLTVANDHTFFVGSARVLVHNADGFACEVLSLTEEELVARSGCKLISPLSKQVEHSIRVRGYYCPRTEEYRSSDQRRREP